MAVLGVISCEILELEVAHLLSGASGVRRVTALENGHSARLVSRLEYLGKSDVARVSSLRHFKADRQGEAEVLLQVLELGLHIWPKKLREALVQAAEEMSPYVDAIMLGYGLCGNALENPQQLLDKVGVPVFVPMDQDHPVDDCVGLLIGGRERYYAEQCKIAGTFFVTPGWAHHWRRLLDREMGGVSLDIARRMFEHYERALLITDPVMSDQEMQEDVQDFVDTFGFRVEACQGTMRILERTWQRARAAFGSSA